MLRIAFCDDDLTLLNDLSLLLDQYRARQDRPMEYAAYQSPLELMSDLDRGLRWDILFLDVMMPRENGMDLAREIRQQDENVKIIFLTASPEFAVESYSVGAYYYLVKPLAEQTLFPVLDRAIEACCKAQSEKLILKCKTGITALDPARVTYCEVIGHSLLLHLDQGQTLESTGRLDELEEKLRPLDSFLRVHRSYLVNMAWVQSISYRAVTLSDGAGIPIPHGKFSDIKKAYLCYALEKERVLL